MRLQVRQLDSSVPGASLKKHSPRQVVLLDFIFGFLAKALLALLPSFSKAKCYLRRVFVGSSPRMCFLDPQSLQKSSPLLWFFSCLGLGLVKPPSR